eukprot:8600015-Heterocapsa_arctica.AAC.1
MYQTSNIQLLTIYAVEDTIALNSGRKNRLSAPRLRLSGRAAELLGHTVFTAAGLGEADRD